MSSSSSYYIIATNDIRMMLGMFTRPLIAVLYNIFDNVVVFVIVNVCIQDDAWDVYTAINIGS